jgi:hypothetical protein
VSTQQNETEIIREIRDEYAYGYRPRCPSLRLPVAQSDLVITPVQQLEQAEEEVSSRANASHHRPVRGKAQHHQPSPDASCRSLLETRYRP